eukprot:scaffold2602_cov31-Tisochrysis_lutea.AAC.1
MHLASGPRWENTAGVVSNLERLVSLGRPVACGLQSTRFRVCQRENVRCAFSFVLRNALSLRAEDSPEGAGDGGGREGSDNAGGGYAELA